MTSNHEKMKEAARVAWARHYCAAEKAAAGIRKAQTTGSNADFNNWLEKKEKDDPQLWVFVKTHLGDRALEDIETLALGETPLGKYSAELLRLFRAELQLETQKRSRKMVAVVPSDLTILRQSLTKKELDMSTISESLAQSRAQLSKSQRNGGASREVTTSASSIDFLRSPVKKSRVEQINEIAEVKHAEHDAFVKNRKAEIAKGTRVQSVNVNTQPRVGATSSTANPRPDQVDANGQITGGMKDPNLGEGVVSPLGSASTSDNGWQSIQDFFSNRTPYGGRR